MSLHPVIWSRKAGLWTMALLKPLGVWGLGGLAFIDAGLFPVPPAFDLVLIGYVAANHSKLILYVFAAALGSALGSLIPYYIGRAGGELFLLKRINRERFEQLRDRFARQEFFFIAIPAMMPPPFPLKVFELAAGVFEMKPFTFASAIFTGKFLRFLIVGIITVVYGEAIVHSLHRQFHEHVGLFFAGVAILLLLLVIYIARKLFDRGKGASFPAEDNEPSQ